MTRTPGSHKAPDLIALSPRETDVVKLVRLGRSPQEIASSLGLEQKTVSDYIHRLNQGLGLRSRQELMLWAIQNPQVLQGMPARVGLHPDGCQCGSSFCAPFVDSKAA